MTESQLLKLIQLEVSKRGGRVFRNNVGRLPDGHGGYVQYGLGVGTSDLIGWTPVIITDKMIGKQIAVFTALEIKIVNKKTIQQKQFIDAVNKTGGISGFIFSMQDLTECENEYKKMLDL